MKAYFIINKIAGKKRIKNIELFIAKYFYLCEYEIYYTEYNGHASEISSQAVRNHINLVIALGGDGTVSECANSIAGSDTILGVIAAGSGNGFAYHFNIKENLVNSIKNLDKLKVEKIDMFNVNNCGLVNVGGVGFDAYIACLFSKSKKRGLRTYIKLILENLNYQAQNYTIEYNGKSRNINAFLIAFANTSQYGNNLKISPRADAKDGLIDLVIVKSFPKWKIGYFFINLLLGRIMKSKYVEIIKLDKVKITSNEKFIHIDGECIELKNSFIEIGLSSKKIKTLIKK